MFLSRLLGRKESARSTPYAAAEGAEHIAPKEFFTPAFGEQIAKDIGDLDSIRLIDINSI